MCASRMSSVHRWAPWIREHIRVPRALCQFIFSPRTCFHSASEYDVGSNLLNFVLWLHNLLDHFFLRCSFVVCIGFVLSDQSFWVPFVVLISCFNDLLCVELRIVSTVTFSNFDTSMWPCTVDRFDAIWNAVVSNTQ